MKKTCVILLLLIILIGCDKTITTSTSTYEAFKESSVSSVVDKIYNAESFLLMITNENCYSCDMYVEDVSDTLVENELTIYTLNYADLSDNEIEQLQIAVGSYTSWPTIFYVVEGKTYPVSTYEYTMDAEGWEAWLIKMELISE